MARKKPQRPRAHAPEKNQSRHASREAEKSAQAEYSAAQRLAAEAKWRRVFPFAAALILVLAGALIFFRLGETVFSHDEAIHAIYGFDLDKYSYDPVYHGPLMYHIVAVLMGFFGDSDFTARLTPALMGFFTIALVMFSGVLLRPQTRGFFLSTQSARGWDNRAALCAGALLAISPVFIAYSRHLIHDTLVCLLTLGAVLSFQTAQENPVSTRRGALACIALAAVLALFICTKANAFFIIAMLFGAWLASLLARPSLLARSVNGPMPSTQGARWTIPLAMFFVVALASVLTSAVPVTDKIAFSTQGKTLAIICVVATLVLWAWMILRPSSEPSEYSENADDESPIARDRRRIALGAVMLAAISSAFFIYAFFYGHGYLWLSKLRAGENIWALYGKDIWGENSAIPRLVEYWAGQQKAPRLAGRRDYYLVLLALYELPIVLAALGGVVRAARQRHPFTDLLIWWSFTSFALYSLANEKVPWLMIHIILPMALLGGWFLAEKWRDLTERESDDAEYSGNGVSTRKTWAMALCALGAIFLLRNVIATSFGRPTDTREPLYYARTSESYKLFLDGLRATQNRKGSIWVQGEAAWPTVWYLRKGAPYLNDSPVDWAPILSRPNPRLALIRPESWWKAEMQAGRISWPQYASVQYQLKNWNRQPMKFDNWSRASWGALRPDRFMNFWLHRVARHDLMPGTTNADSFLAEWSYVAFDVCTPPDVKLPPPPISPTDAVDPDAMN